MNHQFLIDKNICSETLVKTYKNHYNLIWLKCDWYAFVDTKDDPERIDKNPEASNEIENIYNIEFSLSKNISDDEKYKHVGSGTFDHFNIQKFVLKNLSLNSLDENAFDSKHFGVYLETLDLSNNNLKRLDIKTLSNLERLEKLYLANNKIRLTANNFEYNDFLSIIDLSNNDIQYIQSNVFSNLNEIKKLDLSSNSIKTINSCQFKNLQTNPIASKYSPATIDLSNNPIDCNCDLFYLSRHLNYKISANCNQPSDYKNRLFADLKKEDPSETCDYKKMHDSCETSSFTSLSLTLVIVFVVLTFVFCLITCCCCCQTVAQGGKVKKLNQQLKESQENNSSSKAPKMYIDINSYGNNAGDKEKLLNSHN